MTRLLFLASLSILPWPMLAQAPSHPATSLVRPAEENHSAPASSPTVALEATAAEARKAIGTLAALEPSGSHEETLAAIRLTLHDASERAQQLTLEAGKLTGPAAGLEALRDLQTGWDKLDHALKAHDVVLASLRRHFEVERQQVQAIDALWRATGQSDLHSEVADDGLGLDRDVIRAGVEAAERIRQGDSRVAGMQAQIKQLSARSVAGEQAAREAADGAVRGLLARDSNPLWSTGSGSGSPRAVGFRQELTTQQTALWEYLRGHMETLVAQGIVFLLLLGGVFSLRRALHRWTQEDADLKRAAPIFDVPRAAALALSFALFAPAYRGAPPWFHALAGALALLPMIVILRRLLETRFYPELYAVIGFYFVAQVHQGFNAFPQLDRWIFCGEIFAGTLVAVQLARVGGTALRPWIARGYWLAAALLGAALAANALGYVRLGELLGTGTLRSAYLALFLYALRRVVEGLVLIALRVPPLSDSHIARQHRESVQRRIIGVLHGVLFLVWIVVTSGFFELRDPLYARARQILEYSLHVGVVDLSLGRVLSFGLAVWLSILTSRLTRFFLNEEVYERITLAPGLSYAISTMLNYVILLLGCVVALGLLGVDLTKITILAGAFSVGLGFGLQNVINNFVSGIILLFERPVKVGDVIQIGDAVGEVRRIGIRASIVRTRSGADIILPNGNLISNQVTNWSYSDRRGSVEVALSIVRGPDPHHVIELLLVTAGNTLKDSTPEVYATNITATVVSFVVRAWTDYTGDNTQAHSQLSLALAETLARENIPMSS